jgi:hypothetical protein
MPGLITEKRFVELVEMIPVMQQKLDRVLSLVEQISKTGILGISENQSGEIEFSEALYEQHVQKIKYMDELKAKAEKLQREADQIAKEFEL